MLRSIPCAALLSLAAAAPLPAQSPSALDTARVEVLQGRAVVIGGGSDVETVRRDEVFRADGRTQLELSAGSRAHVGWTGTMGLEVFGPASLEWSASGAEIHVRFDELAWADVESRRGLHRIDLPADWRAQVGRCALHLRGIAGGPTEVRVDAGAPVVLDWVGGGSAEARPPVSIYPGSSVRLDRPRFRREEPRTPPQDITWDTPEGAGDGDPWPWRRSGGGDTPAEIAEREDLARQTQRLDELPGAPGSSIQRIRTFEGDGSSRTRALAADPSAARRRSEGVRAQAPLTSPEPPIVQVLERPAPSRDGRRASSAPFNSRGRTQTSPRTGRVSGRPAPDARPRASAPAAQAPVAPGPGARGVAVERVPTPSTTGSPAPRAERAPAGDAAPEPAAPSVPVTTDFVRAQWRGLSRSRITGAGAVAAERGSGVEVRALGQGRVKVFVSGRSPAPRWCFTPDGDHLMHPGAVAVFEADGSIRMSYGTVEAHDAAPGRPRFSDLP